MVPATLPFLQVLTTFVPRADTQIHLCCACEPKEVRCTRPQGRAGSTWGVLCGGQGTTLEAAPCPASSPRGRATRVLTQLAHFQDLTQHLGQLDATAAKGTLMLVFSAAVLKHNL